MKHDGVVFKDRETSSHYDPIPENISLFQKEGREQSEVSYWKLVLCCIAVFAVFAMGAMQIGL